MLTFVSFSTPAFAESMNAVLESARAHGATRIRGWSQSDLQRTAFYRRNRAILDEPRGAGLWAWKPYIILEALQQTAAGGTVIYSDCGRPGTPYLVDRPLARLADYTADRLGGLLPGVYIPQWGPHQRWTKGECLAAMNCDQEAIRAHPQIQATFSVWGRTDRSLAFLSEWLSWCCRPEAISDRRVYPEIADPSDFIDHRHDQSVLTNLVLRDGLRCFGEPETIAIGRHRSNASDKRIGHLIDRIDGRTWAVRARVAAEDRRLMNAAGQPGSPPMAIRAERWVRSWRDAITDYPRSRLTVPDAEGS